MSPARAQYQRMRAGYGGLSCSRAEEENMLREGKRKTNKKQKKKMKLEESTASRLANRRLPGSSWNRDF